MASQLARNWNEAFIENADTKQRRLCGDKEEASRATRRFRSLGRNPDDADRLAAATTVDILADVLSRASN